MFFIRRFSLRPINQDMSARATRFITYAPNFSFLPFPSGCCWYDIYVWLLPSPRRSALSPQVKSDTQPSFSTFLQVNVWIHLKKPTWFAKRCHFLIKTMVKWYLTMITDFWLLYWITNIAGFIIIHLSPVATQRSTVAIFQKRRPIYRATGGMRAWVSNYGFGFSHFLWVCPKTMRLHQVQGDSADQLPQKTNQLIHSQSNPTDFREGAV